MKQVVYLTIGISGSGKSTWAKEKAKEDNTLIINQDSLRTMFKGEYFYDKKYEPLVHEMAALCLKEALKQNFNIILDQTNLGIKKRIFWVNLIRGCSDSQIVYVQFIETKNCLERRLKDPRNYTKEEWEEVIENMKKWYEPPSQFEDYDILINIDANGKEVVLHN